MAQSSLSRQRNRARKEIIFMEHDKCWDTIMLEAMGSLSLDVK